MRSTLVSLLGSFVLPILAAGCTANDPGPVEGAGRTVEVRKLTCFLSCDKDTYQVGEVPKVSVRITNLTGKEIYLIGSLDASDCKWRYPYCSFEMATPYGQPAGGGRCGNTNPLRQADFVRVAPGNTFDPYGKDKGFFGNYLLSERTFREAGEYRLRFVYSTEATDLRQYRGATNDAELVALLAKVPKVTLKSNEMKFNVVEDDP